MISWPKELTKLLRKAFIRRSFFQKKMSKAFSSFYRDASNSKTYLKFCTSLYGRNLPQFNLIDSKQWELFLEELKDIPKIKGDKFLDLGCGMGHNTLEVSKVLNLSGVGVDFSEDAVKKAQKLNIDHLTGISFRLGNFHDPFFLQKNEKYKIIFSLDGLYGLEDWEDMLSLLLDRLETDGKILIFYSSVLKEFKQEGPLDKALESLKKKKKGGNFIFRFYDFTKQEEVFLKKTDKLLEDFMVSFKNEGFDNLYKTKKEECKKGLFWHQKKCSKRLFTVIEKVSF